jgi:hypothetical protein
MARRVQTENVYDDKGRGHDDMAYNLDDLSDHDDVYGEEDYEQEPANKDPK